MTIPDLEPMADIGVCDFPCTTEEERRVVTELTNEAEANLKEGNLYFVISNRSHTLASSRFLMHCDLLPCFSFYLIWIRCYWKIVKNKCLLPSEAWIFAYLSPNFGCIQWRFVRAGGILAGRDMLGY